MSGANMPKVVPVLLDGFDVAIQRQQIMKSNYPWVAAFCTKEYTDEAHPDLRAFPYWKIREVKYGNNICLLFRALFYFKDFYHDKSHIFWPAVASGFSIKPELLQGTVGYLEDARRAHRRNFTSQSVSETAKAADKWLEYLDTSPTFGRHGVLPDSNPRAIADAFFKNHRKRLINCANILLGPQRSPPSSYDSYRPSQFAKPVAPSKSPTPPLPAPDVRVKVEPGPGDDDQDQFHQPAPKRPAPQDFDDEVPVPKRPHLTVAVQPDHDQEPVQQQAVESSGERHLPPRPPTPVATPISQSGENQSMSASECPSHLPPKPPTPVVATPASQSAGNQSMSASQAPSEIPTPVATPVSQSGQNPSRDVDAHEPFDKQAESEEDVSWKIKAMELQEKLAETEAMLKTTPNISQLEISVKNGLDGMTGNLATILDLIQTMADSLNFFQESVGDVGTKLDASASRDRKTGETVLLQLENIDESIKALAERMTKPDDEQNNSIRKLETLLTPLQGMADSVRQLKEEVHRQKAVEAKPSPPSPTRESQQKLLDPIREIAEGLKALRNEVSDMRADQKKQSQAEAVAPPPAQQSISPQIESLLREQNKHMERMARDMARLQSQVPTKSTEIVTATGRQPQPQNIRQAMMAAERDLRHHLQLIRTFYDHMDGSLLMHRDTIKNAADLILCLEQSVRLSQAGQKYTH